MTPWQTIRVALVVLVIGATVWLGLREGFANLNEADSAGRSVASGAQIVYGGAGVVSLFALFTRRSWALATLGIWATALSVTAAMAPVVWGGATWLAGVASGLATVVVAGLIVWGAIAHLRVPKGEDAG